MMFEKLRNSNLLTTYLIASLLLLQFIGTVPNITYASDQFTCGDRLEKAEESYYNGDFDTAILLINQCLQDNNLSVDKRIRGYKLLAKIDLSLNQRQKARESIFQILSLDPAYQPTIEEERPSFVELVNEARAEFEPMVVAEADSGISKWIWIGAGGAAAVAIIAIISSGGKGDTKNQNQPLPGPPDFPE